MTNPKDMVAETARIRIVLANNEAAFMIEQSVQNMGRFAGGRRDHLGVIRPELVGYMGVELDAGILSIMQVDLRGGLALTPGAKVLTIR